MTLEVFEGQSHPPTPAHCLQDEVQTPYYKSKALHADSSAAPLSWLTGSLPSSSPLYLCILWP